MICHIADLHFNNRAKYDSHERIKKQLKKVINKCIEKKAKYIFVAGDIFDGVKPNFDTMEDFTSLVKYAMDNGIGWRILIGNHDTTGARHSLVSLQNVSDNNMFRIISEPDNELFELDKKAFIVYYVPWTKTLKDDLIKMKKRAKKAIDIPKFLFTHGGISNAITSTGYKMTTELDLKLLKGYDYVGLGDYHTYQKLSKGVYYSGSLVRLNYGERSDAKACNFVKIDGNNKVRIIKYKLKDVEFIVAKINYDNASDFYEPILEWDGKKVKDAYVELRIYGKIGVGEKVYGIKRAFYDGGAKDVNERFYDNKEEADIEIEEDDMLSIDLIKSVKKHLKKYKVDKSYHKYGLKILEELC